MISLIIKNIWHRRTSNAWLFIELIIVTIVTWVIIDPVVVTVSDKMLPLGYDEDRLFYITLAEHPSDSPLYKETENNNESRISHIEHIIRKLKAIDEIESVAVISKPLNFVGIIEHYSCGDIQIDTLNKHILSDSYEINKNILSTIGVEVAEGSPSIEELENMSFGYYDVILTETADRYYFPDHRGVNEKYLIAKRQNSDYELKYKVVGIIKDIRLVNTDRNTAYVIHNYNPRDVASNFIVRLKDGINTSEYVKDNRENLRNTAASGNYFVWDIISVSESNKEREAGQGLTASRNLRISLALLFLINLILGVIGTVWLQTRRRISEIGIYRTFGALKIDVRSMLIGENLVLSIAAVVIGLLLYFQYALKEGLFDSVKYPDGYIQNYSWVADFAPHFAIVSAIVAAIILICVLIGTYIPSHKASDIEPVDALRDE